MIQDPAGSSPAINPYIVLFAGVLAISTGAIFARMADAPALVIAAYRVGIASTILLPFAFWKAGAEMIRLSKRAIILTFLSGLFLAIHFATWISSLNYTSVANSVVFVNTNPIWVALLMPFITREKIRPYVIISILASVSGGVIIAIGDFQTGGETLWGDLLAIMGSICAAVYLLLGRILRQKLSLITYIALCYGSAAVILWTIVFALNLKATGFETHTVYALWGIALIPQLFGHSTYNWALKWFSTSFIAVSLLGEPIGSTIMAYFLFDEGLTLSKVIGGAFILSGIYIVARRQ